MNGAVHIPVDKTLAIGSARYLVEASDLGLPPGIWPIEVTTNIGNGNPCQLIGTQPDGTHVYRQQHGVTRIAILND